MNLQRLYSALVLSILLLAGPLTDQASAVVPGDFDDDSDVDLADFADFQTCALGPDTPQTDPVCSDARLDADEDVDLDDFELFQGCLSGPAFPADPNCRCPNSWETDCGVGCADLMTNPWHCGACWNPCAQGDVCAGGTCQGQCSGC